MGIKAKRASIVRRSMHRSRQGDTEGVVERWNFVYKSSIIVYLFSNGKKRRKCMSFYSWRLGCWIATISRTHVGSSRCGARKHLQMGTTRCMAGRYCIFEDQHIFIKIKSLRLNDLLYDALARHSCAFVQLFIDQGVELTVFLTNRRLLELYTTCMSKQSNTTMTHAYKHYIKLKVSWWYAYLNTNLKKSSFTRCSGNDRPLN
jgi:hypothetical protein